MEIINLLADVAVPVAALHQGTCPGKKVSALVVALPEIWDHQFSSFRNNTLAKYVNSQYEPRLSKLKVPFHFYCYAHRLNLAVIVDCCKAVKYAAYFICPITASACTYLCLEVL